MSALNISLDSVGRFDRQLTVWVVMATVTILCHLKTEDFKPSRSEIRSGAYVEKKLLLLSSSTAPKDKPHAKNDDFQTQEDSPVGFNILANDHDKEDESLDGNSIDLNPDTPEAENSVSVESGSYSVNNLGDLTFTPAPNFFGRSRIEYTVSDTEGQKSNKAAITVMVSSVNDPPEITGQTPDPLSATEDQSLNINLSNLIVNDPDNVYPTGFSLIVGTGTNYSVSGTTITPASNFSGNLVVPVAVSDGNVTSNSYDLQVVVNAVNDAPVILSQTPNPLVTSEEQSLAINLNNLSVSDSDNNYPTGFSLIVADGDNYSVSGTTITPDNDYSGPLTVSVMVNDGAVNSNAFDLAVNVNGSNDVPEITGQIPLSVNEDNSIVISLPQLTVTDSDNTYPDDFQLNVSSGTNYSVSGSTVTPSPNFNGTLSVPVFVNDGSSNSNTFPLQISVTFVNDAPVINSQTSLSTSENQSLTLAFSNFIVSDPDHTYPSGFSMTVLSGANYSVNGTTITPSPGFNGDLNIGVQVSDGIDLSNVFSALVSVNAVNDPPVITGQQPITVTEDNAFTPQLSDLQVSDPDDNYPTGFTLTVQPGTNYSQLGNTVIPAQNYNGILSVNVIVNDGNSDSAPFSLQVNITPVNDAPSITGQQTLSTAEDQPITIVFTDLTVTDPDNTYPTGFTLTLSPGLNYTVNGSTITPANNFQGVLIVGAQVNDGSLSSNIFPLTITVNNVNDPPVITGQVIVNTAEDTPVTITLLHLTVFDSDNIYPVGFSLSVGAGQNYSVSGNTVTPGQDFNGTLNIPVTVNDGVNNSAPFNFQIQVGDSNDPPVITGQTPLSTLEEQALTLQFSNLIVTDPDNIYPNGFSILISPGDNFTAQNTTITPALNFNGTLTVPVRVNDGVNNSAIYNLSIQVNPVNDAPSFDAIANQKVLENGTPAVVQITNISAGPSETGQQVTLAATSSNTNVVSNPVITMNGSSAQLRYTLVPNTSGIVTITVVATDNGPGGTPHQNSYSSTFQVEVSELNNAPTLNAIADVMISEDAEMQSINLSGISAGPGETQTLSFEVATDKPELFELLETVYTSPSATGTLRFKTSANSFGVAKITVKLLDNGSAISPSVNEIKRVFALTVQPVNDAPVFTTSPVVVAAVNEPYEYLIEVKDVETANLPLNAVSKPSWATLTTISNGNFRLAGTPPPNAAGPIAVLLRIVDGSLTVDQSFTLVVNNRPTASGLSVSVTEDTPYNFSAAAFSGVYNDLDQHTMTSVQIVQNPSFGKLIVSGVEVVVNDTIPASSLAQLTYQPSANYDGTDAFYWKPFDGYHFSKEQVAADIKILPVNDPPIITIETDTLMYEVNGEPAFITSLFDIEDPDDDSLTRVDIAFNENFDPEYDIMIVESSSNIRGIFDFQSGKIQLTGFAPIEEYEALVKRIQYTHLNTLDPALKMKTLVFTANDPTSVSASKNRLIDLKYTFIDLEIPAGFTPNGDQANDTWIITRPGGLEKLSEAVVRVFNRRGVKVFETSGFETAWDGTSNGNTLPADTYYFTIDLNLRSKKTYKGVVTLLR